MVDPKNDCLQWKIPLKCMIQGQPQFRKPPFYTQHMMFSSSYPLHCSQMLILYPPIFYKLACKSIQSSRGVFKDENANVLLWVFQDNNHNTNLQVEPQFLCEPWYFSKTSQPKVQVFLTCSHPKIIQHWFCLMNK